MPSDYTLFFEFIDTFSEGGFTDIDRDHPLMLEMEEMMEELEDYADDDRRHRSRRDRDRDDDD